MTGNPYDGGVLRLGATVGGETINFTTDDIYLSLMDSTYVQDVAADVHWSDISTHGIVSGAGHPAGGVQLTMAAPYIDGPGMTYNTYPPFRYLVYTANETPVAPNTVPYSVELEYVTFDDITGAVIYKKGGTAATSPLFTFISELSNRTAANDKYWVNFGNPGATLGFYAVLLGTPAP